MLAHECSKLCTLIAHIELSWETENERQWVSVVRRARESAVGALGWPFCAVKSCGCIPNAYVNCIVRQRERARLLGARAAPFCASGRAQIRAFFYSFFIFGVVRRAADARTGVWTRLWRLPTTQIVVYMDCIRAAVAAVRTVRIWARRARPAKIGNHVLSTS